ncbi:acetyl-CoA carboxylase biotin carboxyl carrier protein subunit [Arenibacter sp. 6A1]|uniref:acetyl-CoA carboxylase biotin carboxyl carrier protein subunit n=1 Tax=Arenibacter sp. 6A1 TaxID=2720391 RepID=UPI0014452D1C|nr:acetyl-CoA carboxylase biotin carboxyl carrier protein subunit [Arenibacter sp. 6A1]NKI27035.1 acetyl-CoA carboxylase biotin carboxyl carrier protein subunit [Arenibacter sp. 6A1]
MTNYTITIDNEQFCLSQKDILSLDVIPTKTSKYHVLHEEKSYAIRVIAFDFMTKTMSIEVNGNTYELVLEDEYDLKVKQMGLLTQKAHKINNIKAPMPGLIIDIMVSEGQEISKGTPLLVLSAMKMENIITSTGEGIVKTISVLKNETVEKGQIIIEID